MAFVMLCALEQLLFLNFHQLLQWQKVQSGRKPMTVLRSTQTEWTTGTTE